MNVQRAQEILKASENIEVRLNGQSVWIDSVNAAQNTAMVHPKNQPGDVSTVEVANLEEV